MLTEMPVSESRAYAIGKSFIDNTWYFALPAKHLSFGRFVTKEIAGDVFYCSRDFDGKPFAMKSTCLSTVVSKVRFAADMIGCAFHGWKHACTEKSLAAIFSSETRECLKRVPCREVQGNIWIFSGDIVDESDLPNVPEAPGIEGMRVWQTTTTLHFPNHIDYNVVALIDTAHVPYVHKSWWWRSQKKLKEKEKRYIPSENGWTMSKHKPSKHSIFKYLGESVETEISFMLPGCRREYLSLFGRTIVSGITCLTPVDEHRTELNHTTFFTIPYFVPILEPAVQYFVRTFLSQDLWVANLQKLGLSYNPSLIITIKDSGTPGRWYFMLKKEWDESRKQNRPFANPIKESVLRWRT